MSPSPTSPVRILVVDDEPDLELLIRQRFRRRIRASEFDFRFAANGAEALEVLSDGSDIDIVLTDINMPIMDGLTLLAKITDLNRLLKSVVISAYGDIENIRTAMNRGAFDFLTKPIDFRDLEVTIDKTIEELRNLRDGADARDRLLAVEKELGVAARIQMSILPKDFPPFPDRPELDIFATMQPARDVGGDFYDFFFIDENRLGFVVGDVAGKGVPAAIYMAVSRSIIKATALTQVGPGECMRHANCLLCSDNGSGLFVTLIYGTLDLRTGEVVYTNAGHNPPFLLHPAGETEVLENQGCLVLGVFEDLEYCASRFVLAPGETLFLYTDGVTEAMNAEGGFFGMGRLQERLDRNPGETAAVLINGVLDEIRGFTKHHPQHDDITMLALRYQPS